MVRLALVLGLIGAIAGAAAAQEREVVRFSGSGHGATRPFSINCPCEFQWQVAGDRFSAWLSLPEGKDVALIGNTSVDKSGSYYWPKSGTYYLRPEGGRWTIRVLELR